MKAAHSSRFGEKGERGARVGAFAYIAVLTLDQAGAQKSNIVT